jgi:peptidoglycan hydrolase-like protein with peptidoglycan-binding domain
MAETITASVGTSPAPNRFQDVETIQSLLNQVPPNQGGPQPLLDLDGICGPLTTGAIRRFQQFQFNFQDGRVDPNQRTLAKLNEFDLDPAVGNPIRFQEFQPFDGFEPANPLRKAAPWQMVPLGGSKIVRVLNAGPVTSVTSNNTNIARVLFLGSAVQIFGIAHGTTLIKLRDASGRVLARLDVSVKRKKTVRTSFFFVADSAGNATVRTTAEVDPAITGMNAIWLPQANVEFVKKSVTNPLTFTQDFGTEVRFTAHLPSTGPNAVPISEHEWDIVVARRDLAADFNVFFVTDYEDDVNPGDNADAGTIARQKSCLCDDDLTGHGLDLVLAHEAGHNMGLDHDTVSPANLMGLAPTDTDRRVTRAQIDRVNP